MYPFPDLEPVCCSMSSSNCCFLTCIQISQEGGQVVQYFHLLKNFPQFVVVYIIKGFGIVNKAEMDVFFFLEFTCFFYDSKDVDNLISGSSAFSEASLNIWKFSFHILLNTAPAIYLLYPISSPPYIASLSYLLILFFSMLFK